VQWLDVMLVAVFLYSINTDKCASVSNGNGTSRAVG
jgi:hypothetical protein